LKTVNASNNAIEPTKRTTRRRLFAPSKNLAVPDSPDLGSVRDEPQTDEPENAPSSFSLRVDDAGDNGSTRPISISRQQASDPERQPLMSDFSDQGNRIGTPRYGSIVGSPVDPPDWGKTKRNPVRFDLPDAAPRQPSQRHLEAGSKRKPSPLALVHMETEDMSEEGDDKYPPSSAPLPGRHKSMFQFQPNKVNPTSGEQDSYPSIKKLISLGGNKLLRSGNVPLEAYQELDNRQVEFFDYLDSELEKIESFYKVKEDQATERLKIIREQLHVMRDCHIDELVRARTNSIRNSSKGGVVLEDEHNGGRSWLEAMDHALESARHASFGKDNHGMEHRHSHDVTGEVDGNRDFERHSSANEVPYRTAKLKLKAAMQEFYRGLELLKSYALLNRKAFRKMNKKFDKAAGAPPTLQYMADKVNEAYFVKSHVLRNHIRAVEDLYARYFEGGNYKVASSKLRATLGVSYDYNGDVFRNGLMAATGIWFGIAGLSSAYQLLYHPDPTLALNTNYLLQVSTLCSNPDHKLM
jgi:hypothetical protein